MKIKLTIGMRTTSPNHGEAPASAARRTLMEIAIQRNGSDHTSIAQPSQSGAGRSRSVRTRSMGFKKSHGKNSEDV